MPARWADTLAPEKRYAETFRGLLVQRIEQDFEAEDDIVQEVIDALLEVETKQALDAELEPIFEDGYQGISDWCWETLEQHTSKQTEPSQPETPDSSTPNSSAPTAPTAAADDQKAQQSKRPPIRFNLDAAVPETAPKKASGSKAQQLNVSKPAKASDSADAKQAPASKQPPAAEQQPRPDAQSQPSRPGATAGSSSGPAGSRQRVGAGAPAASARLLHMTGLIRPTDGGQGSSSRDSRQRGRQHEQQARPEDTSRGPQSLHHQQQQQQQVQPHERKRALENPHDRDSRSSSRRGPAAAAAPAACPGSMFRSALGGLRSDRPDRSPKPQHVSDAPAVQQQQQSGHTSVFDRINRADLARIGGAQAQQQQQAPAAKPQQQQQLAPVITGLPKSLQGRVGIISSSTAAPAAARGGHILPDRSQPTAGSAASPPAGSKRKASEAPLVPASNTAATAAAAASARTATASTGHLVQQQQQQQQQQQGGAPAKKTRTAAPAAAAAAPAASAPAAAPGSKEAELAALRAQLQARQAEVQRLKMAQEADKVDQVSVAVFGVSPRVPEGVLLAHFGSCATSCGATIKRCTLLTGRYPPHVAAPGAFLEFGAAPGIGISDPALQAKAAQQATTNALQLSGSMLVDQKITVVRKSEWQASLAKGQRSYAAMRSGPAAPTGSTNRSWTGAASAAAGGASAGGTGVAAAPAAGVTES